MHCVSIAPLARTLILSLGVYVCALPVSLAAQPPSDYDITMKRHELLRPKLDVGGDSWKSRLELETKRSQLESSPEYSQRLAGLTSRIQTAAVYGKHGSSDPKHFRYDADRQVLVIAVNLGALPEEALGTSREIDLGHPGTCIGTFDRAMLLSGRDSLSSSFAFSAFRFPCSGGKVSLVTQEVPVAISEMRQVFARLIWELDITPAPDVSGRVSGSQVLTYQQGTRKMYFDSVLVNLHELRLLDPDTGKVYFRVAGK